MAASISRRRFMTGAAALGGAAALAGCAPLDAVTRSGTLSAGEDLTKVTQRFLLAPTSTAKEFPAADITPTFRANGSINPQDPDYLSLAANGFADFKLQVGGLVEMPMQFSLAD